MQSTRYSRWMAGERHGLLLKYILIDIWIYVLDLSMPHSQLLKDVTINLTTISISLKPFLYRPSTLLLIVV